MPDDSLRVIFDELQTIKTNLEVSLARLDELIQMVDSPKGPHGWRKLVKRDEVDETPVPSPPQIPIPLAERNVLDCSCGSRLIKRIVARKPVLYCMSCHEEVS